MRLSWGGGGGVVLDFSKKRLFISTGDSPKVELSAVCAALVWSTVNAGKRPSRHEDAPWDSSVISLSVRADGSSVFDRKAH